MRQTYQSTSIQPKVEGEVLKWGRCLCAACGNKGKLGATTKPTQQKPVVKILCVDCAIQDICDRRGISFKEAKKRHEEHQKSQEILAKIILEQYKERTGKKPPKNMQELAEIMQPGLTWWMNSLSDSEKDHISEMSKDDQKEHFRKAPILPQPNTPVVKAEQAGRNDPCPCGSGKKYKKCCIEKQLAVA